MSTVPVRPGGPAPATADRQAVSPGPTTPAVGTTRAPVWRLMVASFFPRGVHERVHGALDHLPLALLVLAQGALTLRLTNSAFEDEALYIEAGHDYLARMFRGQPVDVPYGDFFSGLPMLYPVLAAGLDTVGGLWLVRLFSLACMVVAMLCVRGTARHLWGRRAGDLTGAAFVFTGPVMFLGAFATFDAACLALLAVGLWTGVTRSSTRSAVAMGLALGLAPALKYTGLVFVPAVLAVGLLAAPRRGGRVVLAGAVSAAVLGGGYLLVRDSVGAGISFTTSGREALSPTSVSALTGYVGRDVGPLLLLAVVGAVLAVRAAPRGAAWRTSLLALALLAAAAMLPLAQMRLGEAVSFEKHLAYAALFLAPLAGCALAALNRRQFGVLLTVAVLWVVMVTGLARSNAMYQWPDVRPVAQLVERNDEPGLYLSTAARTLAYYTADRPEIEWTEHYGLFDSGEAAMTSAVADGTYEMIVLRSGSSGNLDEDARTAFFRGVVAGSDRYRLSSVPFPVREYSDEKWLIYTLVD